jgi:hypothetical protein
MVVIGRSRILGANAFFSAVRQWKHGDELVFHFSIAGSMAKKRCSIGYKEMV